MSATARLYRRGQWSQAEDGSETVMDVWEIRSTSETDPITTILAASGLPVKDDPHPELSAAIVTELDCDHHDEVLNVWYYNVRYSTKITTREDQGYATQRVKGGMRSGSIEIPAYYDSRGYPLVNTAGDLYEGLSRKLRTRVVPVTANFTSIPNWLFELSDTVNAADVTIHGETYPAGSCMLTDVDMPDEPSRDKDGALFLPITYKVEINPQGWWIVLPNKGMNELVYQTRTSSTAAWVDVTKATYDGKTPTTDRQIIKRRIQTVEQQDIPGDIWLDANGQAQRIVTLSSTQLGTGTISAGSKTLTMASGSLSTTNHPGALIRIKGAGVKGGWLTTRIDSVASASSATLAQAAFTAVTGGQVWVSGAIVNAFLLVDSADWTGVPLPNNQP
jgi:hypothetical protein